MKRLLIAATISLAAARFVFLDADPPLLKRVGDVPDEGYWVQEARNRVLFGEWVTDDLAAGTAAAPLHSLLAYASFRLFGVHGASARAASAASACAAVLLLYLLVRRYDARLALIAAFALAVNNAFFAYSRIGHPETLVAALLLLHFVLTTSPSRRRGCFFLAGACAVFAVLSKLSASYFFAALLLYLWALRARGEADTPQLISYAAGVLCAALPVLCLYYLPRMALFGKTLAALSENASPLSCLPLTALSLCSQRYFALPSVFPLWCAALVYFRERRLGDLLSAPGVNVRALNGVELVALAWFFGYCATVVFFDPVDRRFQLFLIPLLLFGVLSWGGGGTPAFAPAGRAGVLMLVLAALSAGNLLCAATALCAPARRGETAQLVAALLAAAALLHVPAARLSPRYRFAAGRCLPPVALLCAAAALSLNFVVENARIIGFAVARVPRAAVIASGVALAGLLCFGLSRHPRALRRAASAAYAVLCAGLILSALSFPSFSARDASRALGRISRPGEWIVGPPAHELALENALKPLFWAPNQGMFRNINTDAVRRYRPRYYLRAASFEGRPARLEEIWPAPEQVGERLCRIGTYALWPVFGRPRYVAELYRIEYAGEKEADGE